MLKDTQLVPRTTSQPSKTEISSECRVALNPTNQALFSLLSKCKHADKLILFLQKCLKIKQIPLSRIKREHSETINIVTQAHRLAFYPERSKEPSLYTQKYTYGIVY